MARWTDDEIPDPNGPIEDLARWYWENRKELHRSPSIPNYHKDWLSDPEFLAMTLAQRGAYFTCVLLGSSSCIPNAAIERGVGCQCFTSQWKSRIHPVISKFFVAVSPTHMQNKRLLKEFARRAKERKRKRKSGGIPTEGLSHPSALDPLGEDIRTEEDGRGEEEDVRTSSSRDDSRILEREPPSPEFQETSAFLLYELTNPPWGFGQLKARAIVFGKDDGGYPENTVDICFDRRMTREDYLAWQRFARERGQPLASSYVQRFRNPSEVPGDQSRRTSSFSESKGDTHDTWR